MLLPENYLPSDQNAFLFDTCKHLYQYKIAQLNWKKEHLQVSFKWLQTYRKVHPSSQNLVLADGKDKKSGMYWNSSVEQFSLIVFYLFLFIYACSANHLCL